MKILLQKLSRIAQKIAKIAGLPIFLGSALLFILVWAVAGPVFGFSDTWQLIINTSTTILTFLIAICIQYTQNRDTKALHLKLNKLIALQMDLQESLEQIEKELEDEED